MGGGIHQTALQRVSPVSARGGARVPLAFTSIGFFRKRHDRRGGRLLMRADYFLRGPSHVVETNITATHWTEKRVWTIHAASFAWRGVEIDAALKSIGSRAEDKS